MQQQQKHGLLISAALLLSANLLAGCATTATGNTQAATSSGKTLHPSWDIDGNGVNDCENDGSCDHTVDYSQPRPDSEPPSPTAVLSPTFDCELPELSTVEKLICNDSLLANYDQTMAKTYSQALATIDNEQYKNIFKATQRGWVKGRNDCWKETDITHCITHSYIRRQAEIEARFNMVGSSIPVVYTCNNDPTNEFVVTYFATQPPTAIIERGDSSQLLHREQTPDGLIYNAGDYILREKNGKADIQWGYNTPSLQCQVITESANK